MKVDKLAVVYDRLLQYNARGCKNANENRRPQKVNKGHSDKRGKKTPWGKCKTIDDFKLQRRNEDGKYNTPISFKYMKCKTKGRRNKKSRE